MICASSMQPAHLTVDDLEFSAVQKVTSHPRHAKYTATAQVVRLGSALCSRKVRNKQASALAVHLLKHETKVNSEAEDNS